MSDMDDTLTAFFAEGARQAKAEDRARSVAGQAAGAKWGRSHAPGLVLSDLTLTAVQAEATRAHLLHGASSMLGASVTDDQRLAILTEEVGEVARHLNELHIAMRRGDWHALYAARKDELVKELIQVAAMAATWVEFAEGGSHA